jgi:hypothetical protein
MNVLRGFLFENLGLKLVALLLAVVVYLHVYTERPATMMITFPIEPVDVPDSLAVVSPLPAPVMVELRGTGKQLIRLRLTEPRVRISLAGIAPGHFQRAITVDDLRLPRDAHLEVGRIVGPLVVEMNVERVISRVLPVTARIEAHLPAGVRWDGRWHARPDIILIRGPRTLVMKLDSVQVGPARLDGRVDSLVTSVLMDSLPAGCEVEPKSVMLSFTLERAPR